MGMNGGNTQKDPPFGTTNIGDDLTNTCGKSNAGLWDSGYAKSNL